MKKGPHQSILYFSRSTIWNAGALCAWWCRSATRSDTLRKELWLPGELSSMTTRPRDDTHLSFWILFLSVSRRNRNFRTINRFTLIQQQDATMNLVLNLGDSTLRPITHRSQKLRAKKHTGRQSVRLIFIFSSIYRANRAIVDGLLNSSGWKKYNILKDIVKHLYI